MIRTIEALRFRCLRYVSQDMEDFHVLVGPNASGKSTFLDVVAFLGQLVSVGLDSAIEERTKNFVDLVWQREERPLQLAVELNVPQERASTSGGSPYGVVRYEVEIGPDKDLGVAILSEKVVLQPEAKHAPASRNEFPRELFPPDSLISPAGRRGFKTVVTKLPSGNDNYHDETGKGWDHSFKLGPRKSALGNLPDDESRFPIATWLKRVLITGIQRLTLNSVLMRKPSPPGQLASFRPDGSNLPWVIDRLLESSPQRFEEWIRHLRTALPDLKSIRTIVRAEDRHRYLLVCYENGLEVPSWMVSDGTLRLLALTLPAYLADLYGIYLIEEPENGIHPRAVETMYQSLSSVYQAQILMATHSPIILSLAPASAILCFAKTPQGATDIVRGADHPALKEWRGEANLGTLFAAGVLG